MTTLAVLKAKIASDLVRSDLTTQIAEEIDLAIKHYQSTRFYFNETRTKTFDTVASQTWYSASDDPNVAAFINVDNLFITVSGSRRALGYTPSTAFELLTDDNASTGEPYRYTRYAEQIGLYPIPDQVYTVRITGLEKVAAPASDSETDNPWMTDAYDLIRCRTKSQIYDHVIRDWVSADRFAQRERDVFGELKRKTSKQISSGCVRPTEF